MFSREVQALQSENYQLERELHNYQMSISNKCGSAGAPQITTTEQTRRRSSSAMSERSDMRQTTPRKYYNEAAYARDYIDSRYYADDYRNPDFR